jgi:hypothetical protein
MHRTKTFSRALVAALAIEAIIAPVSSARPIDQSRSKQQDAPARSQALSNRPRSI